MVGSRREKRSQQIVSARKTPFRLKPVRRLAEIRVAIQYRPDYRSDRRVDIFCERKTRLVNSGECKIGAVCLTRRRNGCEIVGTSKAGARPFPHGTRTKKLSSNKSKSRTQAERTFWSCRVYFWLLGL